MKNLNNKPKAIIKQINSETAVVIQIPLPPNSLVSTNKLIVTKIKLLPRDIMAEEIGFSMATKNPEIIKLNPINKNEIEYSLNTEIVDVNSSISSGLINNDTILFANKIHDENTTIEVINTVLIAIFNK